VSNTFDGLEIFLALIEKIFEHHVFAEEAWCHLSGYLSKQPRVVGNQST